MGIENTSQRPAGHHLLGLGLSGVSGYIEGMEAAGQTHVVNSDRIPADGPSEALEALGFKLGEVDAADPMFRACELPEGWRREGSSHSMWSYIVDAEGYRRVAIFYKAAFYDRSAHFRVEKTPSTRQQSDAYNEIGKLAPHGTWRQGGHRREGPNYVYVFNGLYGDSQTPPPGNAAYSDNGRRLEVEVAPDGLIVDQREFTAEPERDLW